MQSKNVITSSLEDPVQAARELAQELWRDFTLRRNSVGFVCCDSDMDHEALLGELGGLLDFPLFGCTSIGIINQREGFSEFVVSLTVFTADDVRFHLELSDTITQENVREQVEATYHRAAEALGTEPGLIFALPSYQLNIMLDVYPEVLGQVSGGLPVFGGLPSGSETGPNCILAEGKPQTDRMALLLMGGNIRPLFCTKNILTSLAEQKRTVTEARDNVIYRVGDTTFVDYLRGIGLNIVADGTVDNTLTFVANPLLVEGTGEDEDGVPFVRSLHEINEQDGSGTAIGLVPEGATISVGQLNREDIQTSSRQCIEELLQKMQEQETDDYKYSTIFCVSCIGRFLIMVPDNNIEGAMLVETVGKQYNLTGFYGFGELCPTSVGRDGVKNRAHNESIALCAL